MRPGPVWFITQFMRCDLFLSMNRCIYIFKQSDRKRKGKLMTSSSTDSPVTLESDRPVTDFVGYIQSLPHSSIGLLDQIVDPRWTNDSGGKPYWFHFIRSITRASDPSKNISKWARSMHSHSQPLRCWSATLAGTCSPWTWQSLRDQIP